MLFMIGLWTFLRALLSGSAAIALENPSRTTCRITLRKPRTDALNGKVCGGSNGTGPLYSGVPGGPGGLELAKNPPRIATTNRTGRGKACRLGSKGGTPLCRRPPRPVAAGPCQHRPPGGQMGHGWR